MSRAMFPKLEEAVQTAERVAREVLAPSAERVDREGCFPAESVAALRATPILGALVSREYGGIEADAATYVRIVMALAQACPSTAMIYVMHCGVTRNILTNASEATRRHFLPRAASGEQLYCSARNEPNATATQGYAGKLRISLTPSAEGGYLFDCTKFFASGSTGCDYISAMGRVPGEPPDGDELWVMVPRDAPGVEVLETWDTLGMRGTRSNYVTFRDVRIDPIQCIGDPARDRFGDYAILGQCAAALAIGQSAFDFAVKFLRGEVGEERGIDFTQDVNVQRELGEIELLLEAARMMTHQACLSLDRTGPSQQSVSGAIQRLWYWSRFAGSDVVSRVLQLVGGRGIYRRFPLERIVRDGESIILMGPSKDALATAIGKARLGDGPQFESLWLS